MRQRRRSLRPHTLIKASIAARAARVLESSAHEHPPETPQGVAALDQQLAHAREHLARVGIELDSASELAAILSALSVVVALIDESDEEDSVTVAFYSVLRATSTAFVAACGGRLDG